MDTIGIPNAPYWLNNSTVVVKEDYTSGDEAWILHQLISLNNNEAKVTGRHQDIVKIQRMVQPGSVVSVLRANGRIKTVQLPQEADELLWNDLQYILKQIDLLNEPQMTEDEKKDTSTSANGLSLVH